MAKIDYRNNCWFLTAPGFNCEMGFLTFAGARSFAVNNLRLQVSLTNQAIVRSVTER